jgi:hypothetical protein
MAKEVLVSRFLTDEMISAGHALVEEVRKSNLQIVAAFWLYYDEAERWRLVLASKRFNNEGPLALYRELDKLIYDKDRQEVFGIRLENTTFVDASDELVRALASANQLGMIAGKRLPRSYFSGQYVEDIYVYFIDDSVKPLHSQAWYVGDKPLDKH